MNSESLQKTELKIYGYFPLKLILTVSILNRAIDN